jgi:putative ABC transport system permease protein
VLRQQHNLLFGQQDDFRVFDQSSTLATINGILLALQIFLAAIGAIALVVGGIGIMNIMLVSVTERTREIGVRKAIGATPGSIRLQFLVEALVVTVIAGGLGVLAAAALSAIVGAVQTYITPVVQLDAVLIAVSVSVAIGVIFGLYPAYRASKLQPVEALRYE